MCHGRVSVRGLVCVLLREGPYKKQRDQKSVFYQVLLYDKECLAELCWIDTFAGVCCAAWVRKPAFYFAFSTLERSLNLAWVPPKPSVSFVVDK